MTKRLYLLDAMALLYRAHFAFIARPIRTSSGFNTSAIYGFLLTLLEILEKEHPTHIALAMDSEKPTPRHKVFPQYKAGRQQIPEDLDAAIPHALRFVQAFRIPILQVDGYEADDVIGTLSRRAEQEGFSVFMVTPDKDFGQLVTERCLMWKPGRQGADHEILGPKEVCELWDINHVRQVIDVLGLMGDPTDNIPGVPGIGPKTASKLVRQYGSLEEVLAHADEIKGKIGEALKKYADQARLSKQLATILTDAPMEVDWDDLRTSEPDRDQLRELCEEFEFRSIARRVLGEDLKVRPVQGSLFEFATVATSSGTAKTAPKKKAASAQPAPATAPSIKPAKRTIRTIEEVEHEYSVAKTRDELDELIRQLEPAEVFCFDVETDRLRPMYANLIGLAISPRPGKAWYIPVDSHGVEAGLGKEALERLRPFLTDPKRTKVAHNAKFDLLVLKRQGIEVEGPLFDTMVAHALIDPDQPHGMDDLAERFLGYRPIPIEALIGRRGKDQLSLTEVPLPEVAQYSAEDADVTLRLYHHLKPLLQQHNQERVFYEVEMPVLPALTEMEFQGIRVDPETLRAFGRSLTQKMAELERRIQEMAGMPFNLNSSRQLGEVLFEKLRLESRPKKTRTGQYATDAATLERLAGKHPIVALILEYREMAKLRSTYVDGLIEAIHPETGRVHTTFNQVSTATGRLSSQDPNLQNIPIRTELGQEIRKAFVAREDPPSGRRKPKWLLLSADYSQIELRVVAALSKEESMIEAFEKGLDIHAATAARIFGVPLDQVTPDQRRQAKTVNFGILYGMSAHGLAQRLGIPRSQAKQIIDHYFRSYPKIREFIDRTIRFARETGYVETLTGRRRYLPDINSANATVRGAAERNAINTPVQGTAADMIKIAMGRIYQEIKQRGLRSRMVLQIHDELLFDLYTPEETELKSLVEHAMRTALSLEVPIEVTMGTGLNWLEAH